MEKVLVVCVKVLLGKSTLFMFVLEYYGKSTLKCILCELSTMAKVLRKYV